MTRVQPPGPAVPSPGGRPRPRHRPGDALRPRCRALRASDPRRPPRAARGRGRIFGLAVVGAAFMLAWAAEAVAARHLRRPRPRPPRAGRGAARVRRRLRLHVEGRQGPGRVRARRARQHDRRQPAADRRRAGRWWCSSARTASARRGAGASSRNVAEIPEHTEVELERTHVGRDRVLGDRDAVRAHAAAAPHADARSTRRSSSRSSSSTWCASRALRPREPHLVGPVAAIGALPTRQRRAVGRAAVRRLGRRDPRVRGTVRGVARRHRAASSTSTTSC